MLKGCPKKSELAGPAYDDMMDKNSAKKMIEDFINCSLFHNQIRANFVMCSLYEHEVFILTRKLNSLIFLTLYAYSVSL